MIGRDLEAEVRRLFFAEHWKVGTIAAQLGIHRDAVMRSIGHLGREPRNGPPPSVLDDFKPVVLQILDRYPTLRATRVYDMLVGRGYTGSLRTLRRYVRQVRPRPKTEVFLRLETVAGEQAQIDWGHVGKLQVPGGQRALWVFVMVLSYSRALWAELVVDLTVHSLLRSLCRAAEYFGGMPRQWLFDNAKTVVLQREGDAVRFHPALLSLCASLHVSPRLCGVRKPEHKGSVERAIRYLKERFFAARTIHSIEQGNAQLLDFIDEVTMARPHPVQRQLTVAEVFEQERPRLLPLPNAMPSVDLVRPVSSDKTATVRFDKNRYSVPPLHASKSLTLVASDTHVRLLDGSAEVAVHERCWGTNQSVEQPRHRAELLQHKRAARDGKGRDRLRVQVPRIEQLLQRWVDEGKNIGSLVSRTLKLLDLYGPAILAAATEELLQRGGSDYGALSILCEKRRGNKPVVLPLALAQHVRDRDVIPHDLGGYDDDDEQ